MTYYTYNATTKQLAAAPRTVREGGRTIIPNAKRYATMGAYPLAVSPAPLPSSIPIGKIAIPDGYELQDNAWVRTYRYVDAPPPPPRRWTRLAVKTALAKAGMLAAAREYLAAVEIATGYTAWEALTDCDYIEEGYPAADRWSAILDGAADALGKTRAEIDAFLDAISTEGGAA